MSSIVGELTADGSQIVLIAGGSIGNEIAYQAQLLQTLTPLLKKSDPPGAMVLPASWPAVVQLAQTYGADWHPMPRLTNWIGEQVRLRQVVGGVVPALSATVPAGLTPREYQVAGAHVIGTLGRALITDEPGTGKTITTILGLREYAARRGYPLSGYAPVVCVVPASVVDPWVTAWRLWSPDTTVVAWRGSKERRRKYAGAAHVYVTSYDTARMDAQSKDGPLAKLQPRFLVVDECHLTKSPTARRTQAVNRLASRSEVFVALSGTPITHHTGDIWTSLRHVAPGAWPSRERWIERYCLSVPGDYSAKVLGLNRHAEPEFRLTLLGQHRRVAKADVLDQLPPKIYSIRTVELPKDYRSAYDALEKDMLAELPDGQELSVMGVLAQLTSLSLIACAAADVEVSYEDVENPLTGELEEKRHVHIELKAPSWKADALIEVLEERPEESVVAFAVSKQLVMLAGAAAEKAGRRVGYIVGGQSMRQRTETVQEFQDGKLDLICATTGAGGVGLTLTAARTVVFLQRPWSIVEALQAEDRCHRIGSEIHDSVEIIDIVATGTVESRVRSVLKEKAGQLADLVQDPRVVAELLGGDSVRLPPQRKAS